MQKILMPDEVDQLFSFKEVSELDFHKFIIDRDLFKATIDGVITYFDFYYSLYPDVAKLAFMETNQDKFYIRSNRY